MRVLSSENDKISLVVYLATLIQVEIGLNGVPKPINNSALDEGNQISVI